MVSTCFNPIEKYSSKWESSPNRDENKKYLSCHPVFLRNFEKSPLPDTKVTEYSKFLSEFTCKLRGFLLLFSSILIIHFQPLLKMIVSMGWWALNPYLAFIVESMKPWIHPFKTRVGGFSWFFTNPSKKICAFPQGSGWTVPKIFELTPPCVVNFAYDLKRKMDEHGKSQGSSLKLISPENCLPCSRWLIHPEVAYQTPGGPSHFIFPPGNIKKSDATSLFDATATGSWSTGTPEEEKKWRNKQPLRIQVCPKKGINPTILLWGWDWDHQTYSREGYGSLGNI